MIFNKIKELKSQGKRVGITFSTFDMLHAGHIAMLSEAKNHCDYLICGLQTDPTIDRPGTKNRPVQSIVERQIQLAACRYVDEVVVYQTEQDLVDLLLILPVDVRILGVEYEHKEFTGRQECVNRGIEVVYNGRDHSFSSSSLRKRVAYAETERALKSESDPEDNLVYETVIDPVTYTPKKMLRR
jgi:glycerol-3-phosphate cytidylyltransferase